MSEDLGIIASEIRKRRTFAIISHPDAGKTTLTEKLLLYAGMIHTAGMVKGRKTQKAVSSDWMTMERERGISITASAMQFHYKGNVINVLDTPGHQDFSEDTYRTLTAADSAVMVIDASKGVETQTRKLFAVCRMRNIPILTFMNKMDLPGRDPLDLMTELEEVLGIKSSPVNWPIGTGKKFRGVIDLRTKEVVLFQSAADGGSHKIAFKRIPFAESKAEIGDELFAQAEQDLDLLAGAGNPFSKEDFLSCKLTPVFFGSALTNFGVEPFFDLFAELAPCPGPRKVDKADGTEGTVDPLTDPFAGYVFKIQANMDPRHRDSMAFIRVCAGKFERDLVIRHDRINKELRLSRSHSMFGGERTTIDVAYPGDVVGVVNPGVFTIGDTVSLKGGFSFKPLPKFPPEVVARIRPKDVMRRKSFEKGMKQFGDEGAVLMLQPFGYAHADPLIAAVGLLQFEVLQHRLGEEYNVETIIENLPYRYGMWLVGDPKTFRPPSSSMIAQDLSGRAVLLCTNEWEKEHAKEKNPEHQLLDFIQ